MTAKAAENEILIVFKKNHIQQKMRSRRVMAIDLAHLLLMMLLFLLLLTCILT